MKKISGLFAVLLSFLLSASLSGAQELPAIPEDSRISYGLLPDGVEYYIVSNSTCKGFADLSLVWRLGEPGGEDSLSVSGAAPASLSVPEALDLARGYLAGTDLFPAPGPEQFLRRNGIQGSSCGYVETRDNALIFNFSRIDLSKGSSLTDSLYLMVFDMVRGYSRAVREAGASDCGQAIMISGDIDKDAVLGKFRMLSLFVPETGARKPVSPYVWYPGDSLRCVSSAVPGARVASVTAEYALERVPEKYMKTVLPVVSDQMGEELGMILSNRLERHFRAAGIPVAGVDYRFTGSALWDGDETYSLTVRTVPENVRQVIPAVSSVLSQLAASGVPVPEYAQARKTVGRQLKLQAGEYVLDNSSYIERCRSSFLYGASLASPAERYSFFESSGLADSSGQRFFNRFASSLIDSTKNMTLVCISDSSVPSPAETGSLFMDAWGREDAHDTVCTSGLYADLADTLRFRVDPVKCRIRRTRTESMSGGLLWEFSNGMKVVYKKVPSDGEFWYSLLVRGGFSSARGLEPGQGAFFSDILGLYDVCGMDAGDFGNLLSAMGIDMDRKVNATDMRISGRAPSDSFWFLMKVLIGMTKYSSADSAAFSYYMECEKQRLYAGSGLAEDRLVAIDSIMCPGYSYSTLKSADVLTGDLLDIADSYFRSQFSRVNDGVLVLVGDLDEYELRKKLPEYIGNFVTGKRVLPRGYQKTQTVSGESTYTVNGKRRSLDVAMTAPLQLSILNYMAAEIAVMTLRDTMVTAVSGMGASVNVSSLFYAAPAEKLSVVISAEDCDTLNFASGNSTFRPVRALFTVRSILDGLSAEGITQSRLDMYKASLKNIMATEQSDPAYWTEILPLRFSSGKDIHTDWSARIDEVTVDMVRDIISSLDNGGKVEYIVRPARRSGSVPGNDR